MKTIEQLEHQLKLAKKKNLILGYEHIMNKDYILVRLKDDCPYSVTQKLKTHIKKNYGFVNYIGSSFCENGCNLYIKYNDDGC